MRRRTLLQAAALALSGCVSAGPASGPQRREPRLGIFVPGYRPEMAGPDGVAPIDDPATLRAMPRGYDGPVTMLTRIAPGGPKGDVRRAVYPVRGHAVHVDAEAGLGLMASMSGRQMVAFDPGTLELAAVSEPFDDERVGGGHAVIALDQGVVIVSERHPYVPYSGDPEAHRGRITLRDPRTLAVLETLPCHGIAPHEIRLLDDGRHLAIANYGSTPPPEGLPETAQRFVVEPSITVVDIGNGRLVERIAGPDPDLEIRHLAAAGDGYAAIQVAIGDAARVAVAELDLLAEPGEAYLAAPLLLAGGARATPEQVWAADHDAMRQGLSIRHDPLHGEVIATFPTAHAIIVVGVASGEVRRVIDTRPLGLGYPCGLELHPDGRHYVVTGSFANVAVLERGSHAHLPELSRAVALFRHSHIAIA